MLSFVSFLVCEKDLLILILFNHNLSHIFLRKVSLVSEVWDFRCRPSRWFERKAPFIFLKVIGVIFAGWKHFILSLNHWNANSLFAFERTIVLPTLPFFCDMNGAPDFISVILTCRDVIFHHTWLLVSLGSILNLPFLYTFLPPQP